MRAADSLDQESPAQLEAAVPVTDWTKIGMLLVTVSLAGDEVEQSLIWIVVQNIGRSVASDITFI